MTIERIAGDFTICKVPDFVDVDLSAEWCFTAKTDDENAVVCRIQDVPMRTLAREDGWKAFRIQGVLDFSLIGVLAEISALLAREKIGIFVLSTYNTDYVLVKKERESDAIRALREAGHVIELES